MARPVQAGHEAEPDRITSRLEDNRNGSSRSFCCKGSRRACCGYDSHPSPDQIGYQSRKPVSATLRPTIFDRNVLAFVVSAFAQAFLKGSLKALFGTTNVDKTNNRHRRLLRTGDERPAGCRANN